MSLPIAAIVLFAALLHASWNALLRSGEDGLWTMTVMGVATSLTCALLLPFLPLPARSSWPFIAGSALLHVGYNAFLIRAYRNGEFGEAYPIARGSSPPAGGLGGRGYSGGMAACVRRDRYSVGERGGIISLAFRGRHLRETGILYALGTGLFIAAYSVTDGIGGRFSGQPVSYTLWMCLLWGATALPIFVARRRGSPLWRGTAKTGIAALGGVISLLAYGIVIFAMTRVRPWARFQHCGKPACCLPCCWDRIVFGERLTLRRIGSAAIIAAGALCLE